jgi:hypothetical protein
MRRMVALLRWLPDLTPLGRGFLNHAMERRNRYCLRICLPCVRGPDCAVRIMHRPLRLV